VLAVERQIRPVALGRKNCLFAGSDAGGESAAMNYRLLITTLPSNTPAASKISGS